MAYSLITILTIWRLLALGNAAVGWHPALKCSVPKKPLFGSVEINYKEQTAEFSCNKNFIMVPRSSRIRCKELSFNNGIYYDWDREPPRCVAEGRWARTQECPKLNEPKNGTVLVSSYKKGGKANYYCDAGFVLIGSSVLRCVGLRARWNKKYPVCEARGSVEDFANALQDKFISKNVLASADSEDGVQEKLSVGKAGLDLIFAIDISASIGPSSLKKSKEFTKVIIKRFGISNQTNGGLNGTRISIVTFSDKATILFNLNDGKIRSLEKVLEEVDKIQSQGGGTDFRNLLSTVNNKIYLRNFGGKAKKDPINKRRLENANRAVFIITDAEETVTADVSKIKRLTRIMRQEYRFEVFAIGVGTQIQKTFLAEIASPPYHEHVFEIRNFTDLQKIGNIISEDNIDYGMCGISGNTEVASGKESNKGAWPWLGWVSVFPMTGNMMSCGGVLLCDRFFVTLASCVTEITEDGILTLEDRINVYLGDHDNQVPDTTEVMVTVTKVHVHPNYTGETNKFNVRPYDIALLELGEDNSTRPKLNKFIRPICFAESRMDFVYTQAHAMLTAYKAGRGLKALLAGWGHMGTQKFVSNDVFPWPRLKQIERSLQSENICGQQYLGLDQDMFFCVGNVEDPEVDSCYGDIGGPLMGEMSLKRYTFLGLAVKTEGCTSWKNQYDFSLFLNVLHPTINKWVERLLRGCNRIDEPIPYVDEEENEDVHDNATISENDDDGNSTAAEDVGESEVGNDAMGDDDDQNEDGEEDGNASDSENQDGVQDDGVANGDNENAGGGNGAGPLEASNAADADEGPDVSDADDGENDD